MEESGFDTSKNLLEFALLDINDRYFAVLHEDNVIGLSQDSNELESLYQ